ncbi:OsmC family protein [Vibrio furnissii]|uniref:OsmC family protein n=1 Tax=Vibrio furnissii TaxID=29494 RepID=UPI0001B9337A|nr:OsmC family protein [Vibrio furnissii]EEX40876.1 predicted redox protein [Vibrio furnissii CIP 102972]MCG6213105.1 OsmC family protein [Vibrio furnissii]MCG6230193.1 OsmC family protein [Vibrio furnissii]QDC95569.1 OsmC family peroxiredoxin [Vibrio furnissii]UON50994.1 OsmC family protein [Vibrio furnissii]
MSQYGATVKWQRQPSEVFHDNQYSRGHEWQFDGGVTVPASASPHIVPLPLSVAENVDPEEAMIAALSSCHMLVFLSIAAKKRYVVESYEDQAIGTLAPNQEGKTALTQVVLRPKVIFSGEKQPSVEMLEKMHHQSHENCFIANSVKTEVTTQIVL